MKKNKLRSLFLLVMLLCFGILLMGFSTKTSKTQKDETLEVHFIDVGQGDCTLIKTGDHAMLIDAGDNDQGTKVQLYLKKQNVEKLDYAVCTHPDSDHIGGMDVVLYKIPCTQVFMPDYTKSNKTNRELSDVLKEKNLKPVQPNVSSKYQLGDATFEIIAPNKSDYGKESNDYSIGLILTYGEKKVIFTGDAGEAAEKDIVNNGIDLSADVYQVGHHGSCHSTSQALLDKISPEYAVISCGVDNEYGHPHAETLNRLRQMGVKLFRTDEQGSIVLTTDGKQITFSCAPDTSWKSGEPTKSSQTTKSSQISDTANAVVIDDHTTTNTDTSGYVLNTNTKKFHRPTCQSVGEMKEKNKEYSTNTREQIIQEGYAPCKRCNP